MKSEHDIQQEEMSLSLESLKNLITTASTPALPSSIERPPECEDYTSHVTKSLDALTTLASQESYSVASPSTLASLILLCSEHCNSAGPGQLTCQPWSSKQHQYQATLLLRKVVNSFQTLDMLLTDDSCKILSLILSHLKPYLEKFQSHPSSVCSLNWIASNVSHPQLGQFVPQLLPNLLNWLDSWMPYYKIWGCRLAGYIISTCPSSELVWFGRAALLSDALKRLLGHSDAAVVDACHVALLDVTRILHDGTKPDKPGEADILLKNLITSIELSSDNTKNEIYTVMIVQTSNLLGVGIARWIARLSQLATSQLEYTSSDTVTPWLTQLCTVCPTCMSREVITLLPALIKHAYRISWLDKESEEENIKELTSCLVNVAACNPSKAKLLCHNLENVKVNMKFDKIVQQFLTELEMM